LSGVKIIDRPKSIIDFVVDEDDTLVFIAARIKRGALPDTSYPKAKRVKFEEFLGKYMRNYDGDTCQIRFDLIDLAIYDTNQCILRHHRDAQFN
jgi:Holliday junction resolvase-like predicted endonuclease